MCNVSSYHRTHPVTGFEFDYEHVCKSCAHFTTRVVKKVRTTRCALAPERDTFEGAKPGHCPACTAWQRVMTPVKRR